MSQGAKLTYFFLALLVIVLGTSYWDYRLHRSVRRVDLSPLGVRNLYVITASGLRPDHLSCCDYQPIQTPAMDFLAQEGIRFKHAFTSSPQSLLAHLSLLTGVYPFRNSLQAALHSQPGQPTSLPQLTQAKGYKTACFLADPELRSPSLMNLFEEAQILKPEETQNASREIYRQAGAWIRRHQADPHLILINFNEPTYPFEPPGPYNKHYPNYPYDGETAALDEQIGLLINLLEKNGLYQRSIIVFTAPYASELGGATQDGSIHQDMLHVPLFIVAPGILPEYKTYENQVSLVDVLPTVLSLMGTSPPSAQIDGVSLFKKGSRDEVYRELIYGASLLPDGTLQQFAHSQSGDLLQNQK